MASKPKYTQEICKLSQSSTRLQEQVAGCLLHYWTEDLKGGKSNMAGVCVARTLSFLDDVDVLRISTAAPRLAKCIARCCGRESRPGLLGSGSMFHSRSLERASGVYHACAVGLAIF